MTPSIVFIVGMPRSGTKLLRDLLNHHTDIAIFPHETHFFRPLQEQFRKYGDVTNWNAFSKLYHDFKDATFFKRMELRGLTITAEAWHRQLEGAEFRDLLQALFSTYSQITGCSIVGDKTPSYITQLPMLGSCFPNAKFIHIIRDPRDYALSIRKAWRKDLRRATQRWKQSIRKCRLDASSLAYLEVHYEELVAMPQESLTRVCGFLDLPFQANMLVFSRPSENIGDTRDAMTVVKHNVDKWREQLDADEVRQVELIAGALMHELGYSVSYAKGDEDVSASRMAVGRLLDSINLFRYTAKEEQGLLAGLRQMRRVSRFS
jgi:hypothetical protein